MEGLHMDLKRAEESNLIKGAFVGSSNYPISHLFYADDALLLSECNEVYMSNLLSILHSFFFYLALGLKINVAKSCVYGVGMSDDELLYVSNRIGCGKGVMPFEYLGLQVGSNMNLVNNWKPLIEQTVLNELEKIRMTFFWGRSDNIKKITCVKWDNVLACFEKGGLAIESLKAFNLALICKWIWHFSTSNGGIWVHVIRAIHGSHGGLDNRGCHVLGIWQNMIKLFSSAQEKGWLIQNPIRSKVHC
ncbi:uncharacterized protein [Rutidosis leptorrhynchoides]|uniref:uncharacterized protein n=1 Tax=Rutidosis leptorrhynchoides TaxID=125765 RepID=UPI003A99376F